MKKTAPRQRKTETPSGAEKNRAIKGAANQLNTKSAAPLSTLKVQITSRYSRPSPEL